MRRSETTRNGIEKERERKVMTQIGMRKMLCRRCQMMMALRLWAWKGFWISMWRNIVAWILIWRMRFSTDKCLLVQRMFKSLDEEKKSELSLAKSKSFEKLILNIIFTCFLVIAYSMSSFNWQNSLKYEFRQQAWRIISMRRFSPYIVDRRIAETFA